MAVDNVVLDTNSVNGWTLTRMFSNDIVTTRSGAEQRVQRWSVGRRKMVVPYANMNQSQLTAFLQFFTLRGGSARGFLVWTVFDCFASTAQTIGTGDGTTRAFQITRTYSDGGNSVAEPLLHPVTTGTTIPVSLLGSAGWGGGSTATNVVKVAGALKTEGSDYTINYSTGVVTFGSAPSGSAAVTWQGWYYLPFRFDGDELSLELDSIYAKANPNLIGLFGE